ncbi:site-specific integrase [Mangrovicoccus ximenensis]|uniref:hypothetical protein n=1 Tax=Mangrovicoccus ximenensis TaxID=1911570 RepID=UPI000D38392B|nr:hypothetical protein [Mangrovicoccus ximenensis]
MPDDQKARLDDHRRELTRHPVPIGRSWSLPWQELRNFPVFPGIVMEDDVFLAPADMVPPFQRAQGQRSVDFRAAILQGWGRSDARTEQMLRRLKRIALLDLTQTVRGGKSISKPPSISTWAARTKAMLSAAKTAIEMTGQRRTASSGCPDGGAIFRTLAPDAFRRLLDSQPTFATKCIPRLNALFNAGLFDDWPAGDVPKKKREHDPIQPFCDAAFSEILGACFFLASIQSDLEACYREISAVAADERGRRGADAVRACRKRRLSRWRGKILTPGYAFANGFLIDGEGRQTVLASAWPVATLNSVRFLLRLCEIANAQILAAMTAARHSELVTLGRDPLVPFAGYRHIAGLTYKESENPAGQVRQWPLASHGVAAVRRQQSLLCTLAQDGPYLWSTDPKSRPDISGLGKRILRFGRAVRTRDGTPLAEIDGDLSPHRYRKTMARLAGLCLEGASGVLYDVLGHRDIEVTLGYMLADPDFRRDADRVRHEILHLRRKEIASELDDCGGPAADGLRIAREDLQARMMADQVGEDDPGLLATLIPSLQLVGPGRYCTADSKQTGLCSRVAGQRDIGACNAGCIFRLETAAAAKDRRDAVADALEALSGETDPGHRAYLQGQILANLAPFGQVLDAFLGDPRLRAALEDCDPRNFSVLPDDTRRKLENLLEMT